MWDFLLHSQYIWDREGQNMFFSSIKYIEKIHKNLQIVGILSESFLDSITQHQALTYYCISMY